MADIKGSPGFYDVFDAMPTDITSAKYLFPEAAYVGLGYDFWLCSGNFPEGTEFTFGVNLGAGNASEAVAQVQQIETAFAVGGPTPISET
jgi:hypothetical protein